MKKTLLLTLILCGNVYADDLTTLTDDKPLKGCYKANGFDDCVYTTKIECKYNSDENYRLFGAIVGGMCDDFIHIYRENEKDLNKIVRLKKEVKRLKKLARAR